VPVQVEAVTDEELSIAKEFDWDKDFKQLIVQLRTKLVYLQKTGIINKSMFVMLQRLQGRYCS